MKNGGVTIRGNLGIGIKEFPRHSRGIPKEFRGILYVQEFFWTFQVVTLS